MTHEARAPDEVLDPLPPPVKAVKTGKAPIHDHQRWFIFSRHLYTVLTGGYRSGKTVALIGRGLRIGRMHPGLPVLALEPKWRMVLDVFVAEAHRICERWKIRCAWQESKKTLVLGRRRPVRILFRSGDAGREAVEGVTAGSLLVDEWELIPLEVLKAAVARVSAGPAQFSSFAGTAEGFGPAYGWLLENLNPATTGHRIAPTVLNQRFLRAGYIAEVAGRLSENEAQEKLQGIRTPTGGVVYTRFRRGLHDAAPCVTFAAVKQGRAHVELWADFNTGLMAWAIALVDRERGRAHIAGEVVHFHTDTVEQSERAIAALSDLLTEIHGRSVSRDDVREMNIKIVCDASGDSANAAVPQSIVDVLRHKHFRPLYGKSNPAVEDRVATVQALLGGPSEIVGAGWPVRLTIDRTRAPYTSMCLEQQPKMPTGEPSKDSEAGSWKGQPVGLDHGADAVGYGCFWNFPVVRPAANGEENTRRDRYKRAGYENVA